MGTKPKARVSMFIKAAPATVYAAFVDPDTLTQFWLSRASAPLRENEAVHWNFMVEGAEVDTTAVEND